jgi:hypothetical protein
VSFARAHWSKAVVFAVPLLLALTSSSWLTNSIGDSDQWFYNGYFKLLRSFAADRAAWGAPAYFETRLPIIVPGAIVHGLLPDAAARIVLNICILHGIVALSFWYVVRAHLSALAATAATIMLVTDVFYLRTIGWDYVDNAVLAYQALTFALLTSAAGRADPRLRLAAAGFAATSMLTVHLGSALMLPIFGIYAVYVLEPRMRLLRLIGWGAVGGAACLVVYGLISTLALHGPFAFWLLQLKSGAEQSPARWAARLGVVAISGYWLTAHAAVLVASAAALLVQRLRGGPPLSRLARFCLSLTTILYVVLTIGEALKRSYLLGRAGLYASSFLFLSYLTIAVLVFGQRPAKPWMVWLIGALFPALAIAKLATPGGLGLLPPAMVVLAAIMAVALVIAFAMKSSTAFAGALLVLGLAGFMVRWPFARDDAIIGARNYIVTGGVPPRVFYKESEPQRSVFVSITGALTDHVMSDHYGERPRPIARGDRIVVLDSRIPADPALAVPCAIEGLRLTGFRQFDRRYLAVGVHLFEALSEIPRGDIHCPSVLESSSARFSPLLELAASALPLGVGELEGDVIVAREGKSLPGPISRGPFVHLPAGTYSVTFHYAAIQPPGPRLQRWSIAGLEEGVLRSIAEGQLVGTAGKPGTLSAAFRLPLAMDRLEIASLFSGIGQLSLSAITIEQRLAPKE